MFFFDMVYMKHGLCLDCLSNLYHTSLLLIYLSLVTLETPGIMLLFHEL